MRLLELCFMDGSFLYFASYVMCSRDNVLDQETHHKGHRYRQMLMMANKIKIF